MIIEQELMLIFKFKVEKLKSVVMISAVDYAFLLTGVGVLIGGTYVRKLKQT